MVAIYNGKGYTLRKLTSILHFEEYSMLHLGGRMIRVPARAKVDTTSDIRPIKF